MTQREQQSQLKKTYLQGFDQNLDMVYTVLCFQIIRPPSDLKNAKNPNQL